MLYAIIFASILVLGIATALVQRRHSTEQPAPPLNPADMECCGQHEVCEKESLLAALSRQIDYYEDEELDRFRGRRGDEYSEEEIEEFRNILYTMRDDEVAGWGRSLQLRQVELPDEVKDEVFLIIGERRSAT